MRTLYRASLIHSLSRPATGEWLMTDGRHVMRVGSGEPPAADRTVHLPGATIIPGFIDAHVHLTATGMALDSEADRSMKLGRIDLSLDEIVRGASP